jgi:hypothetical protein
MDAVWLAAVTITRSRVADTERPADRWPGATGVSRLARVPPASRASTTLGQIMPPVPPASHDPAAPLLGRPPLADDLAAIVISDGRIDGIVTVTRLRQIIRREALRAHPAR